MNALVLALVLSAGSPGDSWTPIGKDHFINFLGVWGEEPSAAREIPAYVTYTSPGSTFRSDIGHRVGGSTSPIATLRFSAKYWNIFNDFARNPGVMWTYRDEFMVNGVKFDRSELADFPALQRRARNAKWSFERVEVRMTVNRKTGDRADLVFTHDAVQMIVPSEGRQPITAPGSPRKWTDAVTTMGVSEKEWPKVWRDIDGIIGGTMSVHFYGLRFPDEELAAIMKEARERKKKRKELAKEYETAFDEYVSPAKPYRGGGEDAEPYEPKFPEVKSSTDQYQLMSGSREVKRWPRSEVSKVERVPAARFFRVNTVKHGMHLFDRRGEERAIDGHREFLDIGRDKSGKFIARAELSRAYPEKAECYAAFGMGWVGPYDSSSDARDQIREWVKNAKTHWDSFVARSKPGDLNMCIEMQYELVDVYDYELDPDSLAVKNFTRRYMIWGSRR